jgi:hypothetical protein
MTTLVRRTDPVKPLPECGISLAAGGELNLPKVPRPRPPELRYASVVSLPAKTEDTEIAELRRRLVSLPAEGQARVLEGMLTPGLRLRVLAEQLRHRTGVLTDEQEVLAEREIDDAVREVRRSLTGGR